MNVEGHAMRQPCTIGRTRDGHGGRVRGQRDGRAHRRYVAGSVFVVAKHSLRTGAHGQGHRGRGAVLLPRPPRVAVVRRELHESCSARVGDGGVDGRRRRRGHRRAPIDLHAARRRRGIGGHPGECQDGVADGPAMARVGRRDAVEEASGVLRLLRPGGAAVGRSVDAGLAGQPAVLGVGERHRELVADILPDLPRSIAVAARDGDGRAAHRPGVSRVRAADRAQGTGGARKTGVHVWPPSAVSTTVPR